MILLRSNSGIFLLLLEKNISSIYSILHYELQGKWRTEGCIIIHFDTASAFYYYRTRRISEYQNTIQMYQNTVKDPPEYNSDVSEYSNGSVRIQFRCIGNRNTVPNPSEYNSDTLQMYQMQYQMSHNMIQKQ